MDGYYEFVKGLADRKENFVFSNSDAEKMLSVFSVMLNNAEKEFRIFAGSLCNETTEDEKYIEAVTDFLERGGKLRILLNNFNDKAAFKSKLFRRLYYLYTIGKDIRIRTTAEQPYISDKNGRINVHFSVGDKNSYRIEQDIEKRTAVCNMNGSSQAEELSRLFDKIFDNYYLEDVDLQNLFEGGK